MANLAKENAMKLGMACMDRFYGQKQLLRKINKPLVEKRRRARINSSLQQLKTLVVESLNKTSSPKAKLEKADILEMTVRYIRNMQRHQYAAAASSDPQVVNKYKAGFKACISEVSGFFGDIDVSPDVKTRVLDHLSTSIDTNASPQTKKKPEETVTSEEASESKAPLQTIQVPEEPKPKPVVCKKLLMTSQEPAATAASSSVPSVSENVPVSSLRENNCCKMSTSAIYTSPANVAVKQTNTYQSQGLPVCRPARALAPSKNRPVPYQVARQQNTGLPYRVINHVHANMGQPQQQQQQHRQQQELPAMGYALNVPQLAQPVPEQPMWRPW